MLQFINANFPGFVINQRETFQTHVAYATCIWRKQNTTKGY